MARGPGNPNIGNIAKQMKVGFQKGKSGNPKGRPKRMGALMVNEQLKELGYEQLDRPTIEELYMTIVNSDEERIREIATQGQYPMIARIIAKNIISKPEKSFDVLERIIDRGIGKAKQITETKTIVGFEHNPPEVEDDAEWISQLFSNDKGKAKPPKKKK